MYHIVQVDTIVLVRSRTDLNSLDVTVYVIFFPIVCTRLPTIFCELLKKFHQLRIIFDDCPRPLFLSIASLVCFIVRNIEAVGFRVFKILKRSLIVLVHVMLALAIYCR